MMNFSYRNLLLVITFAALWLGLVLHDHDFRIKKRAVQLRRDIELINQAGDLEKPITAEEIQRSIKLLDVRLQRKIAKRRAAKISASTVDFSPRP